MVDCTVLIVSQRQRPDGFGQQPGYIAFHEAEEILAAATGADLLLVDRNPAHPSIRAQRLARRGMRRVRGDEWRLPAAGHQLRALAAPSLPRDHYDLAVFVGFTVWDMPLLHHALAGRKLADRVAVWFPEAWGSELTDDRLGFEPFGIADAIFVGTRAACDGLRAIAPCPVDYLPVAVDVERFAPARLDGPRPIDVLGIGRRDPALHEALLAWSQRDTKLYVYDTLSRGRITDAAAHRVNLGDTYRRCKIAITNYAKYDLPAVTRDEREIPGRFWEGLASGVTMVGRAPDESLQHELIGESAVIDLPGSPADAVELIDKLHADPDLAVRRHRVQLALRGHDWAHRWARLFAGTGLDVPNRLLARIDRLASTAAELDHTRPGPAAAPSPRPG